MSISELPADIRLHLLEAAARQSFSSLLALAHTDGSYFSLYNGSKRRLLFLPILSQFGENYRWPLAFWSVLKAFPFQPYDPRRPLPTHQVASIVHRILDPSFQLELQPRDVADILRIGWMFEGTRKYGLTVPEAYWCTFARLCAPNQSMMFTQPITCNGLGNALLQLLNLDTPPPAHRKNGLLWRDEMMPELKELSRICLANGASVGAYSGFFQDANPRLLLQLVFCPNAAPRIRKELVEWGLKRHREYQDFNGEELVNTFDDWEGPDENFWDT